MAIVDLDEDFNLIEPNQNNDVIQPKEFSNRDETGVSLLYNKETPLDTITSSLSGYRWTVTYYNQLRAKNDTLVQFDVTASATIQKYNRITNMLLYVQSPLGLENAQNLKGDALIRGDFLPNVYDVFLSTLPSGRLVLFTIDNVENRTANLNKIHYIEYSVLHYIDGRSNIGILNNLNHKVVKKYVYDINHLATRSSPLLLESTYLSKINLSDAYGDILDYYLRKFLSKSRGVLSMPTKDKTVTTDVYLTNFLIKTVETSRYIGMHRLNRFPDDYYKDSPYTILDVLLNKRIQDIKMVEINMGYIDNFVSVYNPVVRLFNNKHGIRYVRDKLTNSVGYTLEVDDLSTYDKYFDSIKPEPLNIEDGKVTIEEPSTEESENEVSKDIETNEENVTLDTDETSDTNDTDGVSSDDREVVTEPIETNDKTNESNTEESVSNQDNEFSILDKTKDKEADNNLKAEIEYLPPILEDRTEYIFSKWFYAMEEEKCGYIEKLVLDYLRGKPIDSKYLSIASEQYHMWSTEQQYDLIPILLFLIKYYFNTLERL